jgi:S1-C subfamily serine protease
MQGSRIEIDSLLRSRSAAEARRLTEGMRRGGIVGAGRVQLGGTSRGWLGVFARELNETRVTAEGRFVRYCDYPVVVSVEPDSPAERAGLVAGDTIVAYNAKDLKQWGEVPLDRLLHPGDTLRVGLRREGRSVVLPVVVGQVPANRRMGFSYVVFGPEGAAVTTPPPDVFVSTLTPPDEPTPPRPRMQLRASTRRPEELAAAAMVPIAPLPPVPLAMSWGSSAALAGAQVVAMDEDLRAALGAKSGVLVLRVGEGTPAGESGLRAGDVIVVANGRAVNTPMVLRQALERASSDRAVTLRVMRRGRAREVTLRW